MDMMTVEELLTTTRSVRKRLDLKRPVPFDVLEKCLKLALQAPTGSNQQAWRFLIVTDAKKRQAIGDYYAKAFSAYSTQQAKSAPKLEGTDPRAARMMKVVSSAIYLSQHMGEVPVHIIACHEGRVEKESVLSQASLYGSILPAAWSLMLALRANGLGSAWTTLHLQFEKEISELLEVPDHFTQTVLLPVAYFTGETFQPAKRISVQEVTYLNRWGQTRS